MAHAHRRKRHRADHTMTTVVADGDPHPHPGSLQFSQTQRMLTLDRSCRSQIPQVFTDELHDTWVVEVRRGDAVHRADDTSTPLYSTPSTASPPVP